MERSKTRARLQKEEPGVTKTNYAPERNGVLRQWSVFNTENTVSEGTPDSLEQSIDPQRDPAGYIMHLQRTIGNRALGELLQAKLSVGPADDLYEKEADEVAEKVVTMPEGKTDASGSGCQISRKPVAEKITPLQRSASPELEQKSDKSEKIEEELFEKEHETDLLQRTPDSDTAPGDEEEDKPAEILHRKCVGCQNELEDLDEKSLQRKSFYQRTRCPSCYDALFARPERGNSKAPLPRVVQRKVVPQPAPKSLHRQLMQKKPRGRNKVPPDIESAVDNARKSGYFLSLAERAYYEPRFGADFSNVKVHNDSTSADLSKSVNARAFTVGNDIFFGAGEYNPQTSEGKKLMAHELTHTIQQGGGVRGKVQRKPGPSMQEGIPVNLRGIAYKKEGVNLREQPLSGGKVLQRLNQNTHFFVSRKIDNWYQIYLDNGQVGYVAASHVKTNLPEPNARIYYIEKGDYALNIAKSHYEYKFLEWGKDLRFYVNVMEYVNRGKGAIYKDSPSDDWDETKVKAGQYIWVPSQDFADTLRGKVDSGSITKDLFDKAQSVGLGSAAEFAMSAGGFVAGIFEGLWKTIWDTLVGLKDVAELIWDALKSIFQGTIIDDLKEFWESLLNLPAAVQAGWDEFKRQWNQPSPVKRWQYRGMLAGRVIGEIALILLTAGVSLAVRGVSGAGKFAKFLQGLKSVQRIAARTQKIKDKLQPVLKKVTRSKPRQHPASSNRPSQSLTSRSFTMIRVAGRKVKSFFTTRTFDTKHALHITELGPVMCSSCGFLRKQYEHVLNAIPSGHRDEYLKLFAKIDTLSTTDPQRAGKLARYLEKRLPRSAERIKPEKEIRSNRDLDKENSLDQRSNQSILEKVPLRKIYRNKHGELTDGIYTVSKEAMVKHIYGGYAAKSVFFSTIDAERTALNAA